MLSLLRGVIELSIKIIDATEPLSHFGNTRPGDAASTVRSNQNATALTGPECPTTYGPVAPSPKKTAASA